MGCCIARKKVDPIPIPKHISRGSYHTEHTTSACYSRAATRRRSVRVHVSVENSYTMMAYISKGAFGQVVRVEHKKTKIPYAMKIIELRNDAEHEIEILRTVNHRYIIKLHDVIKTPGRLYVVMDLATGGELFDRIHQLGKFDENDATRVLRMILEGIQYLHSVGITHRDLKPENILYYHPGSDSHIIITDFGLAAIRKTESWSMSTDCGTVEYMAPEVIQRDNYTNAVDMWSIGVITYILLSGRLPFPATRNINSLLRAICLGKFSFDCEPWESISDDAKSFIRSLLIVEFKKRLTATEALKHKWMKEQHCQRKKNLQKSISSNWTESCLSLNNSTSNVTKQSKAEKEVEKVKVKAATMLSRARDSKSGIPKKTVTNTKDNRREFLEKAFDMKSSREPEPDKCGSPSQSEQVKKNCTQDGDGRAPGERTPLTSRAHFGKDNARTSRGVGKLPPLRSTMTPISTWNEASRLK